MVIEIADAKRHLVVIHDLDDELILSYILAAQDYIEHYIGRPVPWASGGDTPEPVPIPESIKQAARLLVGDSYVQREGADVNPAVRRLLDPYRVSWGV